MKTSIRKCIATDLEVLRKVAIQTYDETFRPFNSSENMKSYLDKAFSYQQLKSELNNPASWFYFLIADNSVISYLKINETEAQTDIKDPTGLEIERIYVLNNFQGKGFGKRLLDFGIEKARQQNKRFVWLGVWEYNFKALQFYHQMGFKKFGSHDFIMGEDRQTDLLLRKKIE